MLILGQDRRVSADHDASALHDLAAARVSERAWHALLDDQDGQALLAKLSYRVVDGADDDGSQGPVQELTS
jgi:hypothetical protein